MRPHAGPFRRLALIPLHLPVRARRLLIRSLLVLLIVATPLWAGGEDSTPLARSLEVSTREHAFSLVRWEVETLLDRAAGWVRPEWRPGADAAADRQMVLRYATLTGEIERLEGERARLVATGQASAEAPRVEEIDRQVGARRAEREALTEPVETIVAWQIDQTLADLGIRRGLLEVDWQSRSPLPTLRITPGVAFEIGPLPNLLVVAPRDRIAVVGSELLSPSLSHDEIERLEAAADGLGVSSLITPIGGLAAYPSMTPASGSVRALLVTVAHEWVHHYLAFRPLGQAYFAGYEMRTINETVADLAGEELGELVYARYYAEGSVPPDSPAATPAAGPSEFETLLRGIRSTVEEYLARGDVAGAEAYMESQRRELAERGYYLRRLNTAYLSFFGAYSGSDNPFESDLRALRREAGSLRAFLEAAAAVGEPAALRRMVD